ncbi:MAG: DUF4097 domain-containing protein [Lachnospiraceae bacterium]|nr:DUF4097 domain-containing protein [Lachnospiraceae bacterium]
MKQKSFVKIYTVIIWSITLILVLAGIGYHIGGIFEFGSRKAIEKTIPVNESVEKLVVDVDAGDVVIKEGDDFEVTFKYPEKYAPTVTLSDNRLEIKQKQKKINGNTNTNKGNYKLTITIPEGTKITSADMNLNLGRLVVRDLDCTDVSANCDAGDFEVKDCTASIVNVNVDMGEINMKDSTITTITANADMGDVNLDVDADTISAHCDMGNVTVKTVKADNEVSIKATCSLGKVTVNGKDW